MVLSRQTVTDREADFVSSLAGSGLRRTHQRLEILRELAAAEDHPDAETIFERVRQRVPTLSQDTVYRTLAALVAQGVVARVPMPRATRFDPDRKPHHHFVCEQCGGLVDVGPEMVSSPHVPGVLAGIGDVHSVSLEIWGVCNACKC